MRKEPIWRIMIKKEALTEVKTSKRWKRLMVMNLIRKPSIWSGLIIVGFRSCNYSNEEAISKVKSASTLTKSLKILICQLADVGHIGVIVDKEWVRRWSKRSMLNLQAPVFRRIFNHLSHFSYSHVQAFFEIVRFSNNFENSLHLLNSTLDELLSEYVSQFKRFCNVAIWLLNHFSQASG